MRQAEVVEIRKSILVIISVRAVPRHRVPGAGKRRNTIYLAVCAPELGPKSSQADDLSAKHCDFEEVGRLEFLKQQIPHRVESILTEPALVPCHVMKIHAMRPQFQRKLLVKKTNALKIERCRLLQAAPPSGTLQADCGGLAGQAPLQPKAGHAIIEALDELNQRHQITLAGMHQVRIEKARRRGVPRGWQ